VPFRGVFGQIFPLELVIGLVVFGLVVVAMTAAAAVSWRKKRRGRPAARREHWHALEAAFGLVLAGVAAFLVAESFSANAADFPAHGPKPAVQVDVTAFQWCWRFRYAGQPVTVIGSCQDGQYPVLVLPAGEPVQIDLTSNDVVHAFWVPYLDMKMDAFPGHVGTFTVTLARDGRWIGRCAQFCGLYHYEMDFWVQAVSPAQFSRWLHAQAGTTARAAA
jgi:cytochrome c oxidase subunit II